MKLNRVDLNLFIVFDAIYSKRNLTRAAEMLCITQPSVSNALTRLRKTLGDPLFVSTPKGMVPTPVAERIAGRVGGALSMLESSILEADVFDPQNSEKIFRVSMNDISQAIYLPKLGASLQKEAPGIKIDCNYTNRAEAFEQLSMGKLDVAVDVFMATDPQICSIPLSVATYTCMVRKDHPIARQPLDLDTYLSLGHVHATSREGGLGHIDNALAKLNKRRNIQMSVKHYMVAPLIVMQTDFALTLPINIVERFDAEFLKLPLKLPAIETRLYWHKNADADKANTWLRKLIVSSCKSAYSCAQTDASI